MQWKGFADQMQRDFHVLTPDFYGHGRAPAWPGVPADIVAADAARIGSLVAHIRGDVHLVGHSYGGAIALRVALRHSASVVSVAVYEPVAMRLLFDFNPKHRAAAEVAEIARAIRTALNGGDLEHAAQRFVDFWSGPGRWERIAPDRQAAIAQTMPVIHAHFVSLKDDVARLRDYAGLNVPVLYLTGRDTRISTRRIAELLESALPEVEPEVLSGMGHLGPITHADVVAPRIAEFVRNQAAVRNAPDRKAA
jgi:pimeloyl-ACP methyl ester carboxylesterase